LDAAIWRIYDMRVQSKLATELTPVRRRELDGLYPSAPDFANAQRYTVLRQ